MSHVTLGQSARATDHAVRRYIECIYGLDLDGIDDQAALARARGIDCEAVRRHLGRLAGVILQTGMRTGVVVVPAERMSVRVPADLAACLYREFPEIPDRAFGRREAVGIIADAKLLDRVKTACGERALSWMTEVVSAFGRPVP